MLLLTVAAVAIGAAAGLALGGRPGHLRSIRWPWLLLAGAALQLVAARLGPGAAGTVAAVAGLACVAAVGAANLDIEGAAVVALGAAANAAVIALDGGMPVRPASLVDAGAARAGLVTGVAYDARHHPQVRGDVLTWFDDRIPVPGLHLVLSVGDVLILAGVALAAAAMLRPAARHLRHRPHWRGPRRVPRPASGRSGADGDLGVVGAAALEVPVEPVEHGAGDGFLDPVAAGQSAAGPAQVPVAQDHQRPVAELHGQEMYRSRFEWHREPEFPEAVEHGLGDRHPVVGVAADHDALAAVGEVDLQPVIGARRRDGEELDPPA